jgi:3',5'-cyclic-AMP phosphodiesterase
MHHPPLRTGVAAWDAIGLADTSRQRLGDVIARHRQVRRIVAGHLHRAIVGELAGRSVLTVPSTYVQGRLDFRAREAELAAEPAGFAVHAVLGDEVVSHLQPVV